ncbi:MAG: hypothetical protein A2Z27_00560 [candidate division Zixibacteria bacterium RBG_16_50_21]|nr:MAG: hypothetical protein A2Z27_00560 [candidate division Zixibacteria bacterium RBG_16_50_21]
MRILDRYIADRFLKSFLISMGVLIVVPVLVDVIEHVDYFVDRGANLTTVVRYYFFYLPYFLTFTIPVACLLSTLFSLGILNKNNEITAMKASGTSLYRVFIPVFGAAILISVLAFLNEEELKPPFLEERSRIKQEEIEKYKRQETTRFYNLFAQGENGWIYHFNVFDSQENTGYQALLQRFESNELREQIEADKMNWQPPVWVLENGRYRVFTDDTLSSRAEQFESFKRLVKFDLRVKPELFIRKAKHPDQMNFKELYGYIRSKSKSGVEVSKELVQLHMKIAFPLASFIIVLFGAPIASTPRRSGLAFSFGATLIISFVYYVLLKFGQSLGYNEKLPPALAAWMGNIVFGVLGLIILFRSRK